MRLSAVTDDEEEEEEEERVKPKPAKDSLSPVTRQWPAIDSDRSFLGNGV